MKLHPARVVRSALVCAFVVAVPVGVAAPRAAAQTADPAAVWKSLARPAMDPAKSASVRGLELQRDRIHLTFTDGTLQFTQPVNGAVFGAVFRGNGRLQISAPNEQEAQQLRLHTRLSEVNLEFTEAALVVADKTFDEIATQVQWNASTAGDDLLAKRIQQHEELGAAWLPRLAQALLSPDRPRTALFLADVKLREHGWAEARFDALDPEEIRIGRWVDVGPVKTFDTWMHFPAGNRTSSEAYRDPLAKDDFIIRSYKIDATVTGGAELSATTRVNFEPRVAGERILIFELDSNLRVDSVRDSQGNALAYFQAREQKDRSQSYGDYVAIALAEPAKVGQAQSLDLRYAGKRAVQKVGNGNYFCESFGWYPARANSFATRADFEINFKSPKRYTLVATGNKVSETTDGDWSVTSWKSELPLAVAGFASGDYKVYNEKAGNVDIDIYANRQPDDFLHGIQQSEMNAMGSLSPSAMAKTMGIEVANTVRLFEAYFGPYPYKHLSVTNIPYSYGQGWPGLLYLSALSFLDSTQRHNLGIEDQVRISDYFGAHESSHQWWGHKVSWKSYHDQWLSEGFADFSGNLYVLFRRNQKEYINRLHLARESLGTRDVRGHAYESVGPVWMGLRLNSSESPGAYNRVVYEKGGYILHMLRMMLYDHRSKNPEGRFQAMMQEFCKTYENKSASSEDFKAIVEKYMIPGLDLDGNHRMDWFFKQYVYGTGIPQYNFRYQVQDAGNGQWKITGSVTRSNVPEGWKDALPLYNYKRDGATRLGLVSAKQPETPLEFVLPFKPEKLLLNYNEDILADIKQ